MIYFPEGFAQADQTLIELLVVVAKTTHGVMDFSFILHWAHMPRSYVLLRLLYVAGMGRVTYKVKMLSISI